MSATALLGSATYVLAAVVGVAMVLGAIDRVELWDRQTWEEKVLPEEARLTMGDDG